MKHWAINVAQLTYKTQKINIHNLEDRAMKLYPKVHTSNSNATNCVEKKKKTSKMAILDPTAWPSPSTVSPRMKYSRVCACTLSTRSSATYQNIGIYRLTPHWPRCGTWAHIKPIGELRGTSQIASIASCTQKVHDWLLNNGLHLNPSKSEAIAFYNPKLKNVLW